MNWGNAIMALMVALVVGVGWGMWHTMNEDNLGGIAQHLELNAATKSGQPVLIDFYADWCLPCKEMEPVLDELKKELGDRVRIIRVDSEVFAGVARDYGITTYPTFVALNPLGRESSRFSGTATAEELKKMLGF